MKWLEPYAAYARLVPALLAIAPAFNIVVALGRWQSPLVSTVASLVLAIGVPIMLEDSVREIGVATEKRLWRRWGGSPTSQLLGKPGATATDESVRARWCEVLGNATGAPLAELDNPEERATKIEMMTRWARESTRDHDRLLAENKRYGYQRNLFALRKYGMAMAAVFGGLSILLVLGRDGLSSAHQGCVILAAVAGLGFWLVVPAERRVRVAGFRYANALFDASTFAKK